MFNRKNRQHFISYNNEQLESVDNSDTTNLLFSSSFYNSNFENVRIKKIVFDKYNSINSASVIGIGRI